MTADEVTVWDVAYDPAIWLPVPKRFPHGDDQDSVAWATRHARERRDRGFTETPASGTLDQYFHRLVDLAALEDEHDQYWALLPDDAPGYASALLDFRPAGGLSRDELYAALAAPHPNQYEPPHIDTLELPNLGEGVRILRFESDRDGAVWASLYYAFRPDERNDVVLLSRTFELALLPWSTPKVIELLGGVRQRQEVRA